MFGGAVSGVALLTLAPLLGKISLMFSAPEYFLIVILGLSIIGGLGGGSMIKGFLMGCFGLFLGTIGTDGLTGQLRFTFGIDGLYAGISTVPALIGLFSISQALILSEKYLDFKNGIHRTLDDNSMKGKFLPSFKEMLRLGPNFIRSAIIGVVVGILPGAGGDIGAWFAYSQAKKASKHPEEFGDGSLEAICASETANNAVTGGSIIPLITLGIPGSTVAAVLLGALILHGLTPGQSMFTKNITTTYTIIIGFILANIMMGLIGIVICRQVVKITKVSDAILMSKGQPVILYYLQRPASLVLLVRIFLTVVVPIISMAMKAVKSRKTA